MGNREDDVELVQAIVDRALTGEHTPFEFIRSLNEHFVERILRKGTKKIIHLLKGLTKASYKGYLKAIKEDKPRVEHILFYKQFNQCLDFYKEELKQIEYSLAEYHSYIFQGHLIDCLTGVYRPEEDLQDYLKREIKIF